MFILLTADGQVLVKRDLSESEFWEYEYEGTDILDVTGCDQPRMYAGETNGWDTLEVSKD